MDNKIRSDYISCPSCLTLFRPKASTKCICCGEEVDQSNKICLLDDTSTVSGYNKIKPAKNLKYEAKISNVNHQDNLNTGLSSRPKNKNKKAATTSYLQLHKFKSKMLLILWILMPLFFIDLSVSVVLKNKNQLAQNYKLRGYLQQFCQLLNCQLPTYKNLDYILIEDNAIVASETQKNTIQVHAMLNNTSNFDQKFPNLKINFTDINGKLISKKVISPNQYLKNYNLTDNNLLEKNTKQYISVLIDDPGQTAVNYEIDLIG
ncbi:MAG: DUF3426 domain-containing protein [Gammaproteobacteria bacterium]|nr:DUF3426 domain-containing protein [Gammaproteobacteria bacterium]